MKTAKRKPSRTELIDGFLKACINGDKTGDLSVLDDLMDEKLCPGKCASVRFLKARARKLGYKLEETRPHEFGLWPIPQSEQTKLINYLRRVCRVWDAGDLKPASAMTYIRDALQKGRP
jgi:hypothetical protein